MNNVVTFRASRKKALLLLFGSICFVALGVWISSEKPLIGWACAAFFALHVLVSLLMMLPNAMYLRLNEEGFEVRSLIRTHKIKWTDVEGFQIGSIRGAKMIAIIYSPEYWQQQIGRAVSASLSGMAGAIPNSYDATLDEVLNALSTWRMRFGRS